MELRSSGGWVRGHLVAGGEDSGVSLGAWPSVFRDYLAEHGITVVLLPGYSPHLNPTEWLWANLKGTELANYCPDDIKDAENEARRGIKRIRRKIPLLTGFLAGTGLSFGSK